MFFHHSTFLVCREGMVLRQGSQFRDGNSILNHAAHARL
jgi:hypothetical protein